MGLIKKILFNPTVRFVAWYMTGTVIIVCLAAWLADVTLKIPYFDFTKELK